jgi:hypothetical protein
MKRYYDTRSTVRAIQFTQSNIMHCASLLAHQSEHEVAYSTGPNPTLTWGKEIPIGSYIVLGGGAAIIVPEEKFDQIYGEL